MSRPRKHVPNLVHHKPTGQGRIRIDGRDVYCGPWGSPECDETYRRTIAEYLTSGNLPERKRQSGGPEPLSVNELILAYIRHADAYYRKGGKPTGEIGIIKSSMKPLRQLYGTTAAADFGPMALKTVRQEMIDSGLCRNEVNKRAGRVKRLFKWGVENELVPPSVFHGLQAVAGLRRGRCGVRESEPVKPVPEAVVNGTLPHLSRQVRDMVRLQLLSGCRPGEICTLRPCDVDTSGDVWLFVPESHKMEHHDRTRTIFFGPRAQQVLAAWIDNRPADAACFSPREAEEERNAERRANRRSPMTPSQAARKPTSNRRRPAAERFTVGAFRRAIHRACEVAFAMPRDLRYIGRAVAKLPEGERQAARERLKQEAADWRDEHLWSPNQLRHSAATSIRKSFGLEAAQHCLGHSDANTTAIYAERDAAVAVRIMSEIG